MSHESLLMWEELVLRFPISRRAIHRLHRCGFEDGGKGDSGQEEGGGRGGGNGEVQLLAVCDSPLRPLVITALHTGFRASELRSLTWTDVEISRRMITVRAGYAKNGEARCVPMNQLLTDILKSVKLANNQGDRPFCNRDGTSYGSFRSAFERALRKAEIVDFTFHDLRQMFESRLVMAGVDLPTVKEILGHRDISMTMRYTHLSSDHKQTAVGKQEQFAAKVPANFTTPSADHLRARRQLIEKSHAPVAQPG
jgi:hypothetical protein